MLTNVERKELLRCARAAIALVIGAHDERAPLDRRVAPMPIRNRGGAFVSLHIGDDLRGCIGYPESDLPLPEIIERCAVTAAISDPRFPAVNATEWPQVDIEISILGTIEPLGAVDEIEIGRHGLIVEQGIRRGLLLPQVAIEFGWDRDEFLEHTCSKAGLAKDAWKNGAKVFKFEAEVFGER